MEKQVGQGWRPGNRAAPSTYACAMATCSFISGLPPFDAEYSAALRAARTAGKPIPPFPDIPFERQTEIVMDHLKALVEAAGSTMDCLLKVIVWLKDQTRQEMLRPHLPQLFHQRRDAAGAHPHAGRPHADGLRARDRRKRLRPETVGAP